MRNNGRKNSKHSKSIKHTLRSLRNIQTQARIRAHTQFSPTASEGPSPSIDTTESQVLRIFARDTADPELVHRSEVPDSAIVDMLKWKSTAVKVDIQNCAADSIRAAIPDHEGFYATMHIVDDCVLVAVAQEDHGVFYKFGIAPEASGNSQHLWTQFGGEGKQPLGPWCLEVLTQVVFMEVFAQAKEAPLWLVDFERALAWTWIVYTRVCKGFVVITDPVTGERRLEDKR